MEDGAETSRAESRRPVPVAGELETWQMEAYFQTLGLETVARLLLLLEQLLSLLPRWRAHLSGVLVSVLLVSPPATMKLVEAISLKARLLHTSLTYPITDVQSESTAVPV